MVKHLITINGLKRVVKKLDKDVSKLVGNSMIDVDELVNSFKEALIKEEGIF